MIVKTVPSASIYVGTFCLRLRECPMDECKMVLSASFFDST